jgi:hypothetical protein
VERQVLSVRDALTAGCIVVVLGSTDSTYAQTDIDFYNHQDQTYLVPLDRFHVLPKFGTRGAGMEFRHDISNRLKLRLEYADIGYNLSKTKRSVAYNLNLKLLSKSVVFDWHPFGGAFRTSAGIVFNRQDFRGSANYNENVTLEEFSTNSNEIMDFINKPEVQEQLTAYGLDTDFVLEDQTLTFDGASMATKDLATLTARLRFREVAPYLGVGWGNKPKRNRKLLYSIDLGVMFIGKPRVDLALSGLLVNEVNQYFPSELEAYVSEEKRKLEEELSHYRYYPVISIGLWYRF